MTTANRIAAAPANGTPDNAWLDEAATGDDLIQVAQFVLDRVKKMLPNLIRQQVRESFQRMVQEELRGMEAKVAESTLKIAAFDLERKMAERLTELETEHRGQLDALAAQQREH